MFQIALEAYISSKQHQVDILMTSPLGKQNVIKYLKDLALSVNQKGCLLSLSLFENELLDKESKHDVRKSFKGLHDLIFKTLEKEYDKDRAQALILLLSSTMFSVAGLGKLKVSKTEVHNMVNEIISIL